MDKTRVLPSAVSKTVVSKKQADNESDNTVVQVLSSRTVVQESSSGLFSKKNTVTNQVGVGDCIKGRFELVEILGMGGMGVVYRARDLRRKELGDSEPDLALKVLNQQLQHHDAALIALQQECRKSQRLAHPNIVNVHDFDRDQNVAFMTMELLHGQPLDETIYAPGFGGDDLQSIGHYLKQIARALQYAHDSHIVHSDFKPGNVFITDSGRVKIFDFGIARAVQRVDAAQDNLKELAALTPAYASLGMLTDQPPEPADDLYAFAVVTYFWLTGRHPYGRKTAQEVVEQGLVPSRPTGLSEEAWKTLRIALSPSGVRSLTVAQFIQGLLPEPGLLGPGTKRVIVGMVLMVFTLAAGWGYQAWENHQYAKALSSDQSEVIQQTLQRLDTLPADRAVSVINDQRDNLIAHALRVAGELEQQQRRHEALQYLQHFLDLMPDSQKLYQRRNRLQSDIARKQDALVSVLLALESRILRLTVEESQEWLRLVQLLAFTEPAHSLLQKERLSDQLKVLVHSQLFMGNAKAVNRLLTDDYMMKKTGPLINELNKLANGYSQQTGTGKFDMAEAKERWRALLADEQLVLLQSPENLDPDHLKVLLRDLSKQAEGFVEAYRWAMRSQLESEWQGENEKPYVWLEALRAD